MTWRERLKRYKKATNQQNKHIAEFTGLTKNHVDKALSPSYKNFPVWAKVMIKNWEQLNNKEA